MTVIVAMIDCCLLFVIIVIMACEDGKGEAASALERTSSSFDY